MAEEEMKEEKKNSSMGFIITMIVIVIVFAGIFYFVATRNVIQPGGSDAATSTIKPSTATTIKGNTTAEQCPDKFKRTITNKDGSKSYYCPPASTFGCKNYADCGNIVYDDVLTTIKTTTTKATTTEETTIDN